MIKVDSYDMEWDIEFKQNKAAFYLCAGDSFKPLLESNSLGNPWEANLIGYIDSCGFGAEAPAEGNSPLLVNDNWNDIIFVRWFMFETAKQGTKAFAKRKTKDLWTYIDLTKNTTKAGNSIQYYYSDNIKLKYTPKASYLGKDFFTISTLFRQDIPNYVNLTFGRQATDSGSGATRCFNWISVGYYDEYVEIRKQGEEWSKHYSIIEKDSSNTANINKFINYYKRYKWIAPDGTFVTTHKLWKQTEEFPTGCEKCIVYTNIKITAVQINGIWEVDSSSTKYDFNNQIENLTIDKMTLSTSTKEDLAIYSPDNQNFYTLKLQ